VTNNDVLPLKAARCDAVAKLKFFWGFESELQTNIIPFHLDALWGATAAYSVRDGLATIQNTDGG